MERDIMSLILEGKNVSEAISDALFEETDPSPRDIRKMVDYFNKKSNPVRLAKDIKNKTKLKSRLLLAYALGWEEAVDAFVARARELDISEEDIKEILTDAKVYKKEKGAELLSNTEDVASDASKFSAGIFRGLGLRHVQYKDFEDDGVNFKVYIKDGVYFTWATFDGEGYFSMRLDYSGIPASEEAYRIGDKYNGVPLSSIKVSQFKKDLDKMIAIAKELKAKNESLIQSGDSKSIIERILNGGDVRGILMESIPTPQGLRKLIQVMVDKVNEKCGHEYLSIRGKSGGRFPNRITLDVDGDRSRKRLIRFYIMNYLPKHFKGYSIKSVPGGFVIDLGTTGSHDSEPSDKRVLDKLKADTVKQYLGKKIKRLKPYLIKSEAYLFSEKGIKSVYVVLPSEAYNDFLIAQRSPVFTNKKENLVALPDSLKDSLGVERIKVGVK